MRRACEQAAATPFGILQGVPPNRERKEAPSLWRPGEALLLLPHELLQFELIQVPADREGTVQVRFIFHELETRLLQLLWCDLESEDGLSVGSNPFHRDGLVVLNNAHPAARRGRRPRKIADDPRDRDFELLELPHVLN